jgi:hypothetical protein
LETRNCSFNKGADVGFKQWTPFEKSVPIKKINTASFRGVQQMFLDAAKQKKKSTSEHFTWQAS